MWWKQYEQEMQGPFPTDAATMRRNPLWTFKSKDQSQVFISVGDGWVRATQDNVQELWLQTWSQAWAKVRMTAFNERLRMQE